MRWCFACAAALALVASAASAKVFFSQKEALELAFPDATRVETDVHILSDAQAKAAEKASRSQLESRIAKFFAGWQDDRLLGYAFIDVHTVRTLPEAFMVVLEPDGRVRSVRVLAFHEPLDYLPSMRWYEQFSARALADPLRLGGDIHGVVGATLSARAVTASVRRVLALFQVLIRPQTPATGTAN